MIIHPRPIQPPPYNEMYVRSAPNLQNTPLCPFLREMDDQEEQIQEALAHPPAKKYTWHVNILGTLKGVAIGTAILGGLGAVIFGTYGFIESSRVTIEIDHYGEEINSRKNRIIRKTQLIYARKENLKNYRQNLNDRLEIVRCEDEIIQLLEAELHLSRVLTQYYRNNFFDNRPLQEPEWNEIFYDYYICNDGVQALTDLRREEDKKGCRIHNSYHVCLSDGEDDDEQDENNEIGFEA